MPTLPSFPRSARPRSQRRPARAPRRAGVRSLLACALVAMAGPHCAGDDRKARFTSEQDAAVVASIEGTWVAQGPEGPVTLVLCEARPPLAQQTSCDVPHFVRGKGLGRTEDVDLTSDSGCAPRECDGGSRAFFAGALRLPDGRVDELAGTLTLADGEKASTPYELPYALRLETTPAPEEGEGGVFVRLDATYAQAEALDKTSIVFDFQNLYYDLGGSAGAGTGGRARAANAGAGGQAGAVGAGAAGQGGATDAGAAGQAGAAQGGEAGAGQGGTSAQGGAAGGPMGGSAGGGGSEGGETAGGGQGGQAGSPDVPTPGRDKEFYGEIAWTGLTFRRVAPGDCPSL